MLSALVLMASSLLPMRCLFQYKSLVFWPIFDELVSIRAELLLMLIALFEIEVACAFKLIKLASMAPVLVSMTRMFSAILLTF